MRSEPPKAEQTRSSWSPSSSRSTLVSRGGGDFETEVVDERPGLIVFRVIGKTAWDVFKDEPGGHRWQRIPPNEKRGRVHTSTVTVAVLPEPTDIQVILREADLEWTTCRGSGPGGQHVNKTESAVQVWHKPSGISVRCETERSQKQNKETARALLRARVWEMQRTAAHAQRSQDRKNQVGSGMRGDKRRTIRVQDGVVKDHLTGKEWRFKEYVRGAW